MDFALGLFDCGGGMLQGFVLGLFIVLFNLGREFSRGLSRMGADFVLDMWRGRGNCPRINTDAYCSRRTLGFGQDWGMLGWVCGGVIV